MTGGAGGRRHAPAQSGATPPSRLRDSTGRLSVVVLTHATESLQWSSSLTSSSVILSLRLTTSLSELVELLWFRLRRADKRRRPSSRPFQYKRTLWLKAPSTLCALVGGTNSLSRLRSKLTFPTTKKRLSRCCEVSSTNLSMRLVIALRVGVYQRNRIQPPPTIDQDAYNSPAAVFWQAALPEVESRLHRGFLRLSARDLRSRSLEAGGELCRQRRKRRYVSSAVHVGHGWASQTRGASVSSGGVASLSFGTACSVSSRASSVAVSGKATWSSGQAARGMLLRCFHDRTVTGCAPIARAKASEPPRRSMSWAADRMATHCMTQRCQASAPLRRVMLHGVTPSL